MSSLRTKKGSISSKQHVNNSPIVIDSTLSCSDNSAINDGLLSKKINSNLKQLVNGSCSDGEIVSSNVNSPSR